MSVLSILHSPGPSLTNNSFRYGVLVAGGWGNYGDIPTSVIMSITGAAPFNGTVDQTLSVAYISAFILVFYVSQFYFCPPPTILTLVTR